MVELILGVWVISFILSMTVVVLNYLRVSRRLRSATLQRVNANLAKVGLFWSSSQDQFVELTPGALEKDQKVTLRSAGFLAVFGLASALGLLILVVVVGSMVFLLKNRKEQALFLSPIAKQESLALEQIHQIVSEIRSL